MGRASKKKQDRRRTRQAIQELEGSASKPRVEQFVARNPVGSPPASDEKESQHSRVFDAAEIADELEIARVSSLEMVRGSLGVLGDSRGFSLNHFAFLGFVERAQAFHQGVVQMVESGNPLAAATLLRSFAENLAVIYYVDKHPTEFQKLLPGAKHGLPMGKVVAAAEMRLPGFKGIHDHLSSMAHPSGAGAFQTMQFEGNRDWSWQSNPTFRSVDEAREILTWLGEMRELCARIIRETAVVMRAADVAQQAPGVTASPPGGTALAVDG